MGNIIIKQKGDKFLVKIEIGKHTEKIEYDKNEFTMLDINKKYDEFWNRIRIAEQI